MKKNSEYVGVDEKFVPEDEKYVRDSILGSREESKRKIKKGVKIGLAVWLGLGLLSLVIFVVAATSIFNWGTNMQKDILDLHDKTVDQMNNNSTNTLDGMKDVIGGMSDIMDGFMNDESNSVNKTTFNEAIEMNSGMNYGMKVISLLDDVALSNKKNNNHIITVVYKEISTTSEDEIVNIKGTLDKFKEYNVSLDYDENGYINKVTIKDM